MTKSAAFFALLLGLFSLDSFAKESKKPFRMGMFRMNRGIDDQKPVAAADSAGYAIQGQTIYGSYNDKFFVAWDFKKKKSQWWLNVEGEATNPPLIAENSIYFSTRSGHVYSVDLATGKKNWDISLDSHSERPLVLNSGKLYVISLGQVAYSIDASSGKRLWVFDAGFPDKLTVRRPPAPIIADGKLTFGIASGELVTVDVNDGKLTWRFNPLYLEYPFHDVVGDMVLIDGKMLMTRYDGLVAQVDMGSERKIVWQDRTTSVATSTFRNGRYYVGLVTGDIIAFDTVTGRSIWRTQTGTTASFLLVGETDVHSISTDGRLLALDIQTGAVSWVEDLGSRIAAPPIVVDNQMYISTGLRNVYSFKL
jgi:outer membrane protein assembly factor BamB